MENVPIFTLAIHHSHKQSVERHFSKILSVISSKKRWTDSFF